MAAAGFRAYARHFSVRPAFDGDAYLLSVARRFTFAAPKGGQLPITFDRQMPQESNRACQIVSPAFDHYTKRHHKSAYYRDLRPTECSW